MQRQTWNVQRQTFQLVSENLQRGLHHKQTSYSLWASSSRAPGAMEAILKISWQTRGTSWSSSWLVELMIRTPSSSPTKTHWSSMWNLRSWVKGQTWVKHLTGEQLKKRGHLKCGNGLHMSWKKIKSFRVSHRRTWTMPQIISTRFRRALASPRPWFMAEHPFQAELVYRILNGVVTDSSHHKQSVPHQHHRWLLTLRSATPGQVKKVEQVNGQTGGQRER